MREWNCYTLFYPRALIDGKACQKDRYGQGNNALYFESNAVCSSTGVVGVLNGEVSTLLMKCIEKPYFNSVAWPNEILECGNSNLTVF